MKYILFFILICVNLATNADTADQEINRACLQQAVTLVKQMKSELYPDMGQDESSKIMRMSTDSCKQQFNETSVVSVKKIEPDKNAESKEAEKDKDSGDWLTDLILKNEVERKAGNKRLERMRRK